MIANHRKTYNPQAKTRAILDRAWEHVQSVLYQVSLRWVFYRLLQDGTYRDKDDYGKLSELLAEARKRFYQGWRPDTLADESRQMIIRGTGYDDAQSWLEAIADGKAPCYLDMWTSQPYYIAILFEARAMTEQFRQYAPGITLVPFAGDPSIPYKWEVAQHLAAMAGKYGNPVKVAYFGDRDDKGDQIFLSAMNDIQDWCDVPFEYEKVGLTVEQVRNFEQAGEEIPENPDKPGEYQWEALTDAQAASLISPVTDLIDWAAWGEVQKQEEAATNELGDLIREWLL
jgi:hypothetical protein